MRRPAPRTLIAAAAALLVGAIALLLVQNLERERYRKYTGYSGEAQSNPYLAAQTLLERQGFRVRTIHSPRQLKHLSPKVTSLFLFDRSGGESDRQLKRIMDWIEAGGHCVSLLDSDEAARGSSSAREAALQSLARRLLGEAGVAFSPGQSTPDDEELPVDMDSSFSFYSRGDATVLWRYPSGAHSHAVSVAYGGGTVSAFGSPLFARNSYIGKKKNLQLFCSIAAAEKGAELKPAAGKREVWFYRSRGFPSLWAVLLHKGWMALVTLLISATLAVWTWAPRFGPVLPERGHSRGDFSHHVAAAGRFFVKQGHSELLFQEMRAAALENVEHRIPGFARIPLERQTELLSKLVDYPRETIRTFLTVEVAVGEEDAQRYITIAERIRRWRRDSTKRQ